MNKANKDNVYALLITNSYIDSSTSQIQEFISLTADAGYIPVMSMSQKVEIPHPSTYLGSGFIEKIKEVLQVILDKIPEINGKIIVATGFDLTGTQRANLKNILGPLKEIAEQPMRSAATHTVHEMARDEARHGKAFKGLLDRYFG